MFMIIISYKTTSILQNLCTVSAHYHQHFYFNTDLAFFIQFNNELTCLQVSWLRLPQ